MAGGPFCGDRARSAALAGGTVCGAVDSTTRGDRAAAAAARCAPRRPNPATHPSTRSRYVIPPPIVHHFCQDVERNGRFAGFMSLGVDWQKLESPPLRRALAMSPGQKGVLVRRVEPTSPAAAVLRKGDVLLSFDGTPIACDGTVFFRANERITFSFLVSAKHAGETAALTVLRDGKELEVRTALSAPERAVPIHINGRAPSFFLFGGLVFLTLSVPLLRAEYGKDFDFDAPVKLLDAMMHGQVGRERRERSARARPAPTAQKPLFS